MRCTERKLIPAALASGFLKHIDANVYRRNYLAHKHPIAPFLPGIELHQ
jgi:hypothetical protein